MIKLFIFLKNNIFIKIYQLLKKICFIFNLVIIKLYYFLKLFTIIKSNKINYYNIKVISFKQLNQDYKL